MWQLWNDATGEVLDSGTEAEMKARYHEAIAKGELAESDAFLEDEAGDQYAWNPNVSPPGWEKI